MEISAIHDPLKMRLEVLKLAEKRKVEEDDIWLLIDNFRKVYQSNERPRTPKILKNILKIILPSKDKFHFTESPIEDILKWELQARNIQFETQKKIGKYRVDFFFKDRNLIVEADGYEFHSNKRQRDYDFKRQLDLIKKGYTVLRFSGSQIYGSPVNCVNKIINFESNIDWLKNI